jgi:hypothetical protein
MKDGLDPADLALLDLEQVGELPSPIDVLVIEEREREHDAALAVDGHETAIANS